MTPQEIYKCWSAEITLLAADTTKTLLAAPPKAGQSIVVTHIVMHVLTAAAQAIDLTIGTVNVMRIPASLAVGSEMFNGPMVRGLVGQAGQALLITPAAAGPSIHVIAEGYYLPA